MCVHFDKLSSEFKTFKLFLNGSCFSINTSCTVQCSIGCRVTTVSFELCPLMESPPAPLLTEAQTVVSLADSAAS